MTSQRKYSDFVAKYGCRCPVPRECHKGLPNSCYFNAAMFTLCKAGHTYVEGDGHAWVIDHEGRTIETTWDELTVHQLSNYQYFFNRQYFGVKYRTDWLRNVVEKRGGLFVGGVSLPSLEYLVFEPLGWEALLAGVASDKVEGGAT